MQNDGVRQFDKLTGLPYYEDFINIAERMKKKAPRAEERYVIIATDVSNFKFINQIYGYDVGNNLLRDLVTAMTKSNSGCLIACRPYSDHVLGLYSKSVIVEELIRELHEVNDRFIAENYMKYQSVSLHLHSGIYVIDNREESIITCIDKANIARRSMKGDYSVPFVFFNEDMYRGKEKTSEVISIFESALHSEKIMVYLQPKMCISSQRLEGAEALSRIVCEDGHIMAPGEYIEILENSGRIIELDKYVMKKTFKLLDEWIKKGVIPVPISINLSRIHFYDERMIDDIMDIYGHYDIPAKYIEFEVTESAFFSEFGLISEKLARLKELGFRVSMDDFGTGYSTLHSLAVLPIDIVKFDRSFIKNSIINTKGLKILGGLISLCKQIDFDVICEGVETKMEEEIIHDCGCESVQGYVYDKPIPIGEFIDKYISNGDLSCDTPEEDS